MDEAHEASIAIVPPVLNGRRRKVADGGSHSHLDGPGLAAARAGGTLAVDDEAAPGVAEQEPDRHALALYDELPLARQKKLLEALDTSVLRIKALKVDMLGSIWEVGLELKEVNKNEAWKGRGKYRHWGQWAETELGISRTHAWRLVQLTEAFTKAEYQKLQSIGFKKLVSIASVAEGDREELIALARSGAPLRVVEAAARARRPTPTTGRPRKTAAAVAEAERQAAVLAAAPEPTTVNAVVRFDRKPIESPLLSTRNLDGGVAAKQAAAKSIRALRDRVTFIDLRDGAFARIEFVVQGDSLAALRVTFDRRAP